MGGFSQPVIGSHGDFVFGSIYVGDLEGKKQFAGGKALPTLIFEPIAFGGLAALLLAITLRTPAKPPSQLTLKEKIAKMDLAGTVLFISSIVCLFLALQWGGLEYPWSDARVWCLVLGFGLLMIAFIALQLFLGEKYALFYTNYRNEDKILQ